MSPGKAYNSTQLNCCVLKRRNQLLMSPGHKEQVMTRRGRSHKVGPAAKVGPCPIGVVNNGTGNISLLLLSNMPEDTDERYQNNSNAISKM